ncbi:unnamed protein product [Orchesella dallaii]|uniref:CHHC U11-48K-type domain-containing protein n=1 Tax=Orchesella dallaii TaxID=48710 RepID=A0ABP1R8R1_9HEXA
MEKSNQPLTFSVGKVSENRKLPASQTGPATRKFHGTTSADQGAASLAAQEEEQESSFGYMKNGEYMCICPYNQYHHVLKTRFSAHLLKCRHQYELDQKKIGKDGLDAICRYNHCHLIPAPELLLHEHSCLDKEMHLIGQYFAEEFKLIEKLVNDAGGEKALKARQQAAASLQSTQDNKDATKNSDSSQPEGAAGFTPAKVDNLLMLYQYRPIPPEVAKQRAEEEAKKKAKMDAILAPDKSELELAQENYGFTRRRRRLTNRQMLAKARPNYYKPKAGEDETHDEAYWDTPSTLKKPINWSQNFKNLEEPILSYPPGLSRAERRKFDVENTIRMATERGHGILNPDEWRKPEDLTKPKKK